MQQAVSSVIQQIKNNNTHGARMEKVDVVIIGSGFGGAVMACRMADKGAKVLVLERGRRWQVKDYPSVSLKNWLWRESNPVRWNGWLDFRYFGDMSVMTGAGVGGGSLIYANVSLNAKPETFERGWPEAIRYAALEPHYRTVGNMLNIQQLPANQWTPRTQLMADAAAAVGAAERFQLVDQAVTFNPDWHYQLPDPFSPAHSKPWVNAHGQTQGTCVHCGKCDIGCPVQAKNTLDLNYLAQAEQQGAEIRPLHQVRLIRPLEQGGYEVQARDLQHQRTVTVQARKVIVAAGSIGSTELLLKCRDLYRTLPKLSAQLGKGWTCNGDFVTPAWYSQRVLSPTRGPTISSAIDFLDGSEEGARFLVEDGGFPDVFASFLRQRHRIPGFHGSRLERALRQAQALGDPARHLMPWFGQAVDEPGGEFSLGRRWWWPWRRDQLRLTWNYRRAEQAVQGLADMHLKLSRATGGEAETPFTWSRLKDLITPHPLGGCNMADSERDGVVNALGEVFHYPDLYVMDGAVVPTALGLNPSKTIAALAEHAATAIN